MNRLFLCFVLSFALLAGVNAQTGDTIAKAEELYTKSRQIDLLNQIVPILLSKDQIKQLLPSIEKVRAKVKLIQSRQVEELSKFNAKMDEAIKAGIEKGEVPPAQLTKDLAKTYKAIGILQQAAVYENVNDIMMPEVLRIFNEGQKKSAAGAIDIKSFEPNAKVDEMKTEDKLKIYVREVLLAPEAYDLLVKMSK